MCLAAFSKKTECMIKSEKPLVIFDLEATGLKISEAQIIAIGALKIDPESFKVIDNLELFINPECELSEDIIALTGITNEKVANAPTFSQVAIKIQEFMLGCDLSGYNLTRFDLPLLAEEFARIDMEWVFPERTTKIIDTQVIYHVYHPRTLSAALKQYCNKTHDNAHDAMGDAVATCEILAAQLKAHKDLPKDIDGLHEFSMRGKGMADWSRMLYYDDRAQLRYNFGKYKDELVEDHAGFASWMLQKDFPLNTLNFLREHLYHDLDEDPVEMSDIPF